MLNWPPDPISYPDWPPNEFNSTRLEFSGIRIAIKELQSFGFLFDQPTPQERNTFFKNATCGQEHNVAGRMVVSPDGLQRWPFAVCVNATHQELLTLWPPYSAGPQSGIE